MNKTTHDGSFRIQRHFTTPGIDPYDEVQFETRDARIVNHRDGSVVFEQTGVEVPATWSQNAVTILASKYFRGTLGSPDRERSLKQVIDRIVDAITTYGRKEQYFLDVEEEEAFASELKYLLLHQKAAFNSPVWFNVGVPGVPNQVSACFILSVEDDMESILRWYTEEGIIFKGGSGAGVNLSKIRGSTELLSGGGTASGPVSFMRGADASAGTIKSGGKCLAPWTKVYTEEHGAIEISKLAAFGEDFTVLSFSPALQRFQASTARVFPGGRKSLVKITTDKGHFTLSPDHPVRLTTGDYVPAGCLYPEVSLLSGDISYNQLADSTSGSWHADTQQVVSVSVVDDGELFEVYDVEVDDPSPEDRSPDDGHNFLIWSESAENPFVGSGIVVHNTRRAAKMVILNVDHPDIEEFIWCKAVEERKARVLRDAGFDMDLDGKDSFSLQYQNANNSVRVTDAFMQAVLEDKDWDLIARTDGRVLKTVKARSLFRQIAQAAWECADPGVQFDTTINKWHTTPNAGRINGSNPCSEYMHLDNSSCNLASLNLMAFLNENNSFDVDGFCHAVEVMLMAQEILVGYADYPVEKIGEVTRRYRQLGIGYANLGAALMALGLPYDSEDGRAWAASVTALMTGHAYMTSAAMAKRVGPFDGFEDDRDAMLRVIKMHRDALDAIDAQAAPSEILDTARDSFDLAVAWAHETGVRNAQVSVLAPTGTIGLLMDCDTTGVEPDLGLVKTKQLVGGGSLTIVNHTVPRALRSLGYQENQIEDIVAYIDANHSIVGAPHLRPEHLPTFACSMGDNTIHYMGHVRMMAAIQPFLSGAISKTVNMPEDATVDDIENLYREAWRMGLKAVAIYRDNCKVAQPLSSGKKQAEKEPEVKHRKPAREHLPRRRRAMTRSFQVADLEGYLTVGEYDDGRPGELFVKVSKQGSTLAGVMDALAIAVSLGLQHGVPLSAYVRKYTNMRFEPAGITDDPDVRMVASLMDYVARRLALDYLDRDEREEFGIFTRDERMEYGSHDIPEAAPQVVAEHTLAPEAGHQNMDQHAKDAPLCYQCGVVMRRAGACFVCEGCGSTSGCS